MSAEEPPVCAPPDLDTRKSKVVAPPLACDSHAHVIGPSDRYPPIAERVYTPAIATPAQFGQMLDVLGIDRAVLVQPSVYGTDNRAMLDALAEDAGRRRGVAVVPFDTGPAEIERLHGQGVRGVRCNIVDLKSAKGVLPLDGLRALGESIAPFGWHVELLMHVNDFPDLDRQFKDFPVDLVFGHLGYVPAGHGTETEGFHALLRLMRDGKAWVKLTAPYRMALSAPDFPEVAPFADRLLEAAPERLLWGSDWPHVFIKTPMPNDGDLFDLFAHWVPDDAARRRILVDNPARLYDF